MNIRFSEAQLRIRLGLEDTQTLLERGFLDESTRFPNGKRFRYGIRVARIPDGQDAPPIVLNFSTEGGGFGADLVLVVVDRELQRLIARAGSKTDAIESSFPLPKATASEGESEPLRVVIEIDVKNVKAR